MSGFAERIHILVTLEVATDFNYASRERAVKSATYSIQKAILNDYHPDSIRFESAEEYTHPTDKEEENE